MLVRQERKTVDKSIPDIMLGSAKSSEGKKSEIFPGGTKW